MAIDDMNISLGYLQVGTICVVMNDGHYSVYVDYNVFVILAN